MANVLLLGQTTKGGGYSLEGLENFLAHSTLLIIVFIVGCGRVVYGCVCGSGDVIS